MIEEARKHGIGTEEAMWKGIETVDALLADMEEEHPGRYWRFMRQAHESLYGCHYDETFGRYDVSVMTSKADGKTYKGEHWSMEEILTATREKVFPAGVTQWDKYVAYNAGWHDWHKVYADEDILDISYLFFFDDDDWEGGGKIWRYMCMKALSEE